MVLWIFGKKKRRFEDLKAKRITLALRKLRMASTLIASTANSIDKHIHFLKNRIHVLKQRSKDLEKVGMYGEVRLIRDEIYEVQKMIKKLVMTRNILEKVKLKLDTLSDMSEALIILAPALNVLRKIVRDLMKVKPEIAYQISTVKELIYSSLLDLGEFTRVTIEYYVATSYEAKEILEEAKKIAEQKLEEI